MMNMARNPYCGSGPAANPLCNARFGASASSQTFVSTFLILDRTPFINTCLGMSATYLCFTTPGRLPSRSSN
jgi:hypothetical protein